MKQNYVTLTRGMTFSIILFNRTRSTVKAKFREIFQKLEIVIVTCPTRLQLFSYSALC